MLRPTRVLSAAIIPFLVVAFAVLYPVPTDTKRLFAWQIRPTMTPMVLGAVYLGGSYFFLRAVRARRWHTVAGGFLPVGSFATLMGIATILHWNKFLHGNVAFWLWAGLYFTTPVLVFAVFAYNHREYSPATGSELRLSGPAVAGIAVAGGLSLATCALLFLSPATAIDIWPWQLTPLTARTLGAIFALGGAGLGVLAERRWSAVRIPIQVAGIMMVLILVAGLRAHSEFDSGNPLTWLFAVGFGGGTLATAALYLMMESRARSSDPG